LLRAPSRESHSRHHSPCIADRVRRGSAHSRIYRLCSLDERLHQARS
jgi:hypothetical protein